MVLRDLGGMPLVEVLPLLAERLVFANGGRERAPVVVRRPSCAFSVPVLHGPNCQVDPGCGSSG